MYRIFLVLVFAISVDSTDPLSKAILSYFESETVYYIRKEWGNHREAIEHAIELTMQETVGSSGLNVFLAKPTALRLTDAYYHDHGEAQIIFSNMDLQSFPKCWLPQVSLSLASNVLKFEVPLTTMIITADYNLIRNKSNIVSNVKDQDANKVSPFLFYQVPNEGKVAFSVRDCILSGYVMTSLKSSFVDLGHKKMSLTKCQYFVELYKDSSGSPPIISQFSASKPTISLELKHFLLRPIKEDFILKLQAALFSTVNTTTIFGSQLRSVREAQEEINEKCAHGLNKIIRGLNEKLLDSKKDDVKIEDFVITWDDTPYSNHGPERIELSNMMLSGLGTAYNSHTGGPYKLDKVMIGETIVYSTLQIRGIVSYTSAEEDHYKFSVEISDFAISVDVDVKDLGKYSEGEVVGFRKIEFAMPEMINIAVAKFIKGYLINVLPKIVVESMTVDLDPKLMESREADESKSDETNETKESIQNSEKTNPKLNKLAYYDWGIDDDWVIDDKFYKYFKNKAMRKHEEKKKNRKELSKSKKGIRSKKTPRIVTGQEA